MLSFTSHNFMLCQRILSIYVSFHKTLTILKLQANTLQHIKRPQKYVSHFIHEVPSPLRGHPGVRYSIGTEEILFQLAPKYSLPNLGVCSLFFRFYRERFDIFFLSLI